jgi:thioredoxin 2
MASDTRTAAPELDDKGIVIACAACGQKNRLVYGQLGAAARCGQCKQPLTGVSVPVDVPDAAAFDRLIASASLPVVVDFWAPWCGPCRMVAPELVKVAARQSGRYVIAKLNTDAVPEIGDRFRIRSIPTMAVFSGGREVARTTGARPATDIEAFISPYAAPVHAR